jgi:hypothetical protein
MQNKIIFLSVHVSLHYVFVRPAFEIPMYFPFFRLPEITHNKFSVTLRLCLETENRDQIQFSDGAFQMISWYKLLLIEMEASWS